MRQAVVLLAPLLVCACTEETSLDLIVDGDLEPGVDMDELLVEVLDDGAQVWTARRAVGTADVLPLAFQASPLPSDAELVDVSVAASSAGRRVISVVQASPLSRGTSTDARLCLWQRCIADPAGPGCTEGLCDPGPGDADADADVEPDADGDADPVGDGDADGEAEGLCNVTCLFAADGVCEDGGEDSTGSYCEYGTDCADCGPRDPAACVPRCELRSCGSDGCGGTCSPGCEEGEECMPGGACIPWVEVVPDGPFVVGSPEGEAGRWDDELQHEVLLSHGFRITPHEVSQGWFTALLGNNLASFQECGPDCPMESINWHLAALFATFVSISVGLAPCYACSTDAPPTCDLSPTLTSPYECEGFRLPTEAEWELAARAGTTTATYNGDLDPALLGCEPSNAVLDSIAWFCGNSPEVTHPSGQLAPNGLGLFDMLGNVQEMVHDWYGPYPSGRVVDPWGPATGTDRAMRGGSFFDEARATRCATRYWYPGSAGIGVTNLGFRVVQTLH